MHQRIAIVYNEPLSSRYDNAHEEKAVLGVLDAVNAVHKALRKLNYDVSLLPLLPPLEEARQKLLELKADIIFNLFEGFCGEPETEILVPETLSVRGIPYTGCDANVLKLALDKARVKEILKASGIPTPDFQLVSPDTLDTLKVDFPCIVKPRAEDASHGISADSLVRDFAALEKQVRVITKNYRSGAIVEHFIGGREFNATVMGNSECVVLPVSEIVYSLPPEVPRILTFAAKWETDSPYSKGTRVVCPAKVTAAEHKNIIDTTISAFKLLVGRGYARMDMRLDETGTLNIIEVNPNPDISPGTGAARQSRAAGMSYSKFIKKLIDLALEKKMTVKIRPMLPGDKPSLLRILKNTPEFKPFEVTIAEELIDSYLADGIESGYIVQIAEDNGEVAGYICYGETPCTVGTWDIYWIAVDRSRRGKGLGKALSETAEAAIKRAHGRLAFIETSSTPLYENTRQFYLAQGYEQVARIPDFYMPGDDKIILQKRL